MRRQLGQSMKEQAVARHREGMREFASTLACSDPKDDTINATAVSDTATGRGISSVPRSPPRRSPRRWRSRAATGVEIREVHEQVQRSDHQHAADEGARQVALRIADFARQRRHIVPAVVGPERARAWPRRTPRCRRARSAATPSQVPAVPTVRFTSCRARTGMPRVPTRRPAHLGNRRHQRRAPAGGDRRAVDERHGPDRRQRDDRRPSRQVARKQLQCQRRALRPAPRS